MSKAGLPAQILWHDEHAKPGVGGYPIAGFADGSYTLWLPDPTPTSRVRFIDGAPVTEDRPSAMNDPAIAGPRAEVLEAWHDAGGGIIRVPLAFMAYASACIRAAYNVTDADLEFLLLRSNKWHAPMVAHLAGGDLYLEAFAKAAKGSTPSPPPLAPAVNPLDAAPVPPPADRVRLPWWKRLRDKLRG